jgi:hypothetical protein
MSAPSSPDDSGFLSRWSRRKLQAEADTALSAPPVVSEPERAVEPTVTATSPPVPTPAADQPPPPTLDELAPLDHSADLTRFIAKGVDEGVRRAALHKLFADPQFNVMDGLDTYIDDYNAASPVPPGLLARLKLTPNLGFDLPEAAAATPPEQPAVARAALIPQAPVPTLPSAPPAAAQPGRDTLPDTTADSPSTSNTPTSPP